jgi:hypothetical protein
VTRRGSSAAADEVNDLDHVVLGERRLGVERARDDLAILLGRRRARP